MPRDLLEGVPRRSLQKTSEKEAELTMVLWDRSTGATPGSLQATNIDTRIWPNLLGIMFHTTVQETLQQAASNRSGQLKKLAQLPEFKVKEAGTNTPQIISATTALDATACATHLKIKI